MSQTQTQTPYKTTSQAPYTKEELEKEVRRVEEKMSYVIEHWEEASRFLYKMWRYLSYATDVEKLDELYDRIRELETNRLL
jgi:DNA-dependent RNA polymerase auxiliary subunit epsilon